MIMAEILQDKRRSMGVEGRRMVKERVRGVIAKFSLEEVRKEWPKLIESKEQSGYNAAFITHPRDN